MAKNYSDKQVQSITSENILIKLWATAKVSPFQFSKIQLEIIKKFIKTDIPWNTLTGDN
ncbi:MAG: hypothetical protein PHE73_09265 [Sulfurovaceae bacterium]|nr:hypothetical protein [Sulfurovaceae bacterium]